MIDVKRDFSVYSVIQSVIVIMEYVITNLVFATVNQVRWF